MEVEGDRSPDDEEQQPESDVIHDERSLRLATPETRIKTIHCWFTYLA